MMVRVLRRLCATLFLFALVAGCTPSPHNIVTQTDRDRADVLSHDPITALAVDKPLVEPGLWYDAKSGWTRGSVLFAAYTSMPTDADHTPVGFEAHVATVLSALRSAGWTVYWAACLPTTDPTQPGAVTVAPTAYPTMRDSRRSGTWEWDAEAYKISGGVSYAASVGGEFFQTARSSINVKLLAPNQHDPANLFGDQPPALSPGSTCAEDGAAATRPEQAGVAAFLSDNWKPYAPANAPER